MLKKIATLLLVALIISMTGCGNSIPENLTEETYNLGKQALKVMDKYLAGKTDIMTANDELRSIADALNAERDILEAKSDAGDIQSTVYSFNNGSVYFDISSFAMGILGDKNYDCQEARDSLADRLELN